MSIIDSALKAFTGPQIFNGLSEIGEGAIRSAKNHPKGLVLGLSAANIAYSAGTAPKGKIAIETTAAGAGEVGALVGGAVGSLFGGGIGGTIGSIVGYQAASIPIAKTLYSGVKTMQSSVKTNFGGRYQDTEIAFTMRQRAAQELSGSLLNARHWLGAEANLYHT